MNKWVSNAMENTLNSKTLRYNALIQKKWDGKARGWLQESKLTDNIERFTKWH